MKLFVRVLVVTLTIVLFCGHLLAQAPDSGKFVALPGIPSRTVLNASVAQSQDDDANLYTIFSNLGKKPNCYYPYEGWTVSGKKSLLGFSQYVAMDFTPKADATVTEIRLALFNVAGKQGAVISLNEDSNGLPGNPIHTWVTKKLGNYGKLPCVLTMVSSKQGLPVHKGTQYWVVAAATGTEWDGWLYTYDESTGDLAIDYNDQGWVTEDSNLAAFAVLGLR